ncbi:MAG: hypothetical protein AB1921_09705 [Thermodesulfobacteriota bacterium]
MANGAKKAPKATEGLMRSIMIAHLILLLHAALAGGLFVSIIFFQGLVHYMPWIFLTGAFVVVASGLRVYAIMKRDQKTLAEILRDPLFAGRPVTLSFMGGLVSLRVGSPERPLVMKDASPDALTLAETPASRARELSRLAGLYERNLLSWQEYEDAKKDLLSR